jgi:ParB family chromosome partitioning protein
MICAAAENPDSTTENAGVLLRTIPTPAATAFKEVRNVSNDVDNYEMETDRVQHIPISDLKPFEGHPFKVVDDEAMLRTTESIAQFGVLTPLLVRPMDDGSLQIISGHRRVHAAEAAGLSEVPVIVRHMTDDEAVVLMVDSNLQRENILPSERAFAYKMKLEAMKRQGERTDLQDEGTSRQVVGKLEAADVLGQDTGESGRQVQRYIRLTNLIPELLEMVDQQKISFNPAVELSYLTPEEQQHVIEAMDYTQASPSLSQAMRLKKLSQEGGCTLEDMYDILGEIKKGDLERVAFKSEQLRKYFPKSYTPRQMQDTIIKLLEQWQKKRQRGQER